MVKCRFLVLAKKQVNKRWHIILLNSMPVERIEERRILKIKVEFIFHFTHKVFLLLC